MTIRTINLVLVSASEVLDALLEFPAHPLRPLLKATVHAYLYSSTPCREMLIPEYLAKEYQFDIIQTHTLVINKGDS